MLIQPISDKTSYTGQVIVLGKISKTQNYLFNLHKANLIQIMKDKPYDLFAKQSKSRKTITLMTEKDAKTGYFVRKNKQNFEECAQLTIKDKDKKLLNESIQDQKKAREMADFMYVAHQMKIMKNFFMGLL